MNFEERRSRDVARLRRQFKETLQRVNDVLPDPTARIVTVCEFGKISTLAAATLRDLGFLRAAALDGGMKAWRDGKFPVEKTPR